MKKTMSSYFIALLLCLNIQLSASQKAAHPLKDTWVTVFVHGSFSLKPHLTVGNAINVLCDRIENSVYYRSTEINRRDHFFHKNQVMLGLGLQRIDFKNPNKLEASRIIAASYEKISQLAGNAPSNDYYAFGWSGLVSHKLRYLEAGILYDQLNDLVKKMKAAGKNPKIRVISYSHGGTLCIQLGAIHVTKAPADQFFIDELYLNGTPIQIETDYLINSPVFKKVYNIYSKADSIQKLDFFSFKRFFSRRKFENRNNFQIPEKLVQISLNIVDYTPKDVASTIQFPCDEKTLRQHFKKCTYDPGHFELWFMGWTILSYRKDFPLNPLPIIDFLPIIVKDLDKNPDISHDIIVRILPYKETIEIYNYKKLVRLKKVAEKPFLTKKSLDELKTIALQYEPVDYNLETYNRKMYDAISIAQYEYDQLNELKIQEFKNIKDEKSKNKKPSHEKNVVNLQKDKRHFNGFLNNDEKVKTKKVKVKN